MAQNVLQVCNLPVTCPLRLQRRNEICSATFSLWGKLGAPRAFSCRGTQTEGKETPQSCSPICSSESFSASSKESVEGCKKAPHQLTP